MLLLFPLLPSKSNFRQLYNFSLSLFQLESRIVRNPGEVDDHGRPVQAQPASGGPTAPPGESGSGEEVLGGREGHHGGRHGGQKEGASQNSGITLKDQFLLTFNWASLLSSIEQLCSYLFKPL